MGQTVTTTPPPPPATPAPDAPATSIEIKLPGGTVLQIVPASASQEGNTIRIEAASVTAQPDQPQPAAPKPAVETEVGSTSTFVNAEGQTLQKVVIGQAYPVDTVKTDNNADNVEIVTLGEGSETDLDQTDLDDIAWPAAEEVEEIADDAEEDPAKSDPTPIAVVSKKEIKLAPPGSETGDYGYKDGVIIDDPVYGLISVAATPENLKIAYKEDDLTLGWFNTTFEGGIGPNTQVLRYGKNGPYIIRQSLFTDNCIGSNPFPDYKMSESLARAVAYITDNRNDAAFCREPSSGAGVDFRVQPFALESNLSQSYKLSTPISRTDLLTALDVVAGYHSVFSSPKMDDPVLVKLCQAVLPDEITALRKEIIEASNDESGVLGTLFGSHETGAWDYITDAAKFLGGLYVAAYIFGFHDGPSRSYGRTFERLDAIQQFIFKFRVDKNFRDMQLRRPSEFAQRQWEYFKDLWTGKRGGGPWDPPSQLPTLRNTSNDSYHPDSIQDVDSEPVEPAQPRQIPGPVPVAGLLPGPTADENDAHEEKPTPAEFTGIADTQIAPSAYPGHLQPLPPSTTTASIPSLVGMGRPSQIPWPSLPKVPNPFGEFTLAVTPEGVPLLQRVPPEINGPQVARSAANPAVDVLVGRSASVQNPLSEVSPARLSLRPAIPEAPGLAFGLGVLGASILVGPLEKYKVIPKEWQTPIHAGLFSAQALCFVLKPLASSSLIPSYYAGQEFGQDLSATILAPDGLANQWGIALSPENVQIIKEDLPNAAGATAVATGMVALRYGAGITPVGLAGTALYGTHEKTEDMAKQMDQLVAIYHTEAEFMAKASPGEKSLMADLKKELNRDLKIDLDAIFASDNVTADGLQQAFNALKSEKYKSLVRMSAPYIQAAFLAPLEDMHFRELSLMERADRYAPELLLNAADSVAENSIAFWNWATDSNYDESVAIGSDEERRAQNRQQLGSLLAEMKAYLQNEAEQQKHLEIQQKLQQRSAVGQTYVSTVAH